MQYRKRGKYRYNQTKYDYSVIDLHFANSHRF